MESILIELFKASPGIGLAIIIFVVMIKYLRSKDDLSNIQFDRIETMHKEMNQTINRNTEAFGTITEVIRKCQINQKA